MSTDECLVQSPHLSKQGRSCHIPLYWDIETPTCSTATGSSVNNCVLLKGHAFQASCKCKFVIRKIEICLVWDHIKSQSRCLGLGRSTSERTDLYEYPLVPEYIPAPHQLQNQSLGSELAGHPGCYSRKARQFKNVFAFHYHEKSMQCSRDFFSHCLCQIILRAPKVFLDGHDIFKLRPKHPWHYTHVISLSKYSGTDLSLLSSGM